MSKEESEEQFALSNIFNKIVPSSSDLNEIGKSFAFQLKQLMNIDWAALGLIEKSKGLLRLFPLSPEISSDWEPGDTISLDGSPIAWLSQNKVALVEPDLAKESRFWTGTFWLKKGIRTIVYMPLLSGGEVFGGLIFASHQIQEYGDRELKLLSYAADQITTLIRHVNILAPTIEEQRSNRTLEEILLRLVQAQQAFEESIQSLRSHTNSMQHFNEPSTPIKDSSEPKIPEVREKDIIKAFIVDEKVLSRRGLSFYLSQTEDIKVIGECYYSPEDTILMIEQLAPDVALVDINPPSLSGLDLARQIVQRLPNIPVILLTPYENDAQILKALKAGVAGYLTSNITTEELSNAIRRVAEGNRIINNLLVRPEVARRVLNRFQDAVKVTHQADSLTPQHNEILGYFVKGYAITKVAHTMAMSEEQIKNEMTDIVSNLMASECNR